MTLRLHSDWRYLEQEFGCSIRDRFLMAIRSLDNPRAVTPFLLEAGGRRFGLYLHVERGNVEAARIPPDIAPVYYKPYFLLEMPAPGEEAHASLADAVERLAGGERRLVLDPAAPLSVATELQSRFAVELEAAPAPGTVTLVEVACNSISARLHRGRAAAAKAASRLLEKSPVRDRLRPWLQTPADTRFATLDAALSVARLSAVVVSSTLNAQEIGGIPVGRKQRPLAVIYRPGEGRAWIMEPGCAAGGRQFASPQAALNHAAVGGRLGIETEDLAFGLSQALGINAREWVPADGVIRQWRDENTLADLPYYIIASRTTRHAIEAALAHATEALRERERVTEMDSYGRYLAGMRDFAAAALPGLRVARTLTNFHCGSRTVFPANPAAYPLDGTMNTLKIDSGCLLFDDEGVLLGCSDIARTIATTEAARELYALFEDGVRHRLIPGARAGRAGAELHADAVDAVWSQRARLAGNPLFVDFKDPVRAFDRDVGHLLGKNNLAHLRFVSNEIKVLREGMIACCEYQWPIKGHAVAYEDTCLVTAEGGLNLTSDEG